MPTLIAWLVDILNAFMGFSRLGTTRVSWKLTAFLGFLCCCNMIYLVPFNSQSACSWDDFEKTFSPQTLFQTSQKGLKILIQGKEHHGPLRLRLPDCIRARVALSRFSAVVLKQLPPSFLEDQPPWFLMSINAAAGSSDEELQKSFLVVETDGIAKLTTIGLDRLVVDFSEIFSSSGHLSSKRFFRRLVGNIDQQVPLMSLLLHQWGFVVFCTYFLLVLTRVLHLIEVIYLPLIVYGLLLITKSRVPFVETFRTDLGLQLFHNLIFPIMNVLVGLGTIPLFGWMILFKAVFRLARVITRNPGIRGLSFLEVLCEVFDHSSNAPYFLFVELLMFHGNSLMFMNDMFVKCLGFSSASLGCFLVLIGREEQENEEKEKTE